MRLKTVLLALVGGLALVAPAAAAREAGVRGPAILLPPDAAGALRPGDVVELRWHGVPPVAAEMELLLSLDGGRTFPLRVTPDLDAERGWFAWRVPPLPSADARLALRMNLGGREVLAATSAPFRIAAGSTAAPWTVRSRDGDLWLGGPDGDSADPIGRDAAAGAPHPHLAPFWPEVAPGPPRQPRPLRQRAAAATTRADRSRPLADLPPVLPAPFPPPLDLPLRI